MVTALAETARGKVSTGEDYLLLGNGTDRLLLADGSSFLLLDTSLILSFVLSPSVDDANGSVSALNPSVSVAGGSVTATAGVATGSVAANGATTSVSTSIGVATASAAANSTTTSVATQADDVSGDWQSLNPTVATAAEGTVVAQPALGSMVVGEAAHQLGPSATPALATVDTNDAAPVITSPNPDPSPYAVTYELDADSTHLLVAAGTYRLDASHTYHVKR